MTANVYCVGRAFPVWFASGEVPKRCPVSIHVHDWCGREIASEGRRVRAEDGCFRHCSQLARAQISDPCLYGNSPKQDILSKIS